MLLLGEVEGEPFRPSDAIGALIAAVEARAGIRARQAALDVRQGSLDLELRYRPVAEIDLARFDLWAARLQVDAAAGNEASVNGDVFALDYIRDRIQHALKNSDRTRLNTGLEELYAAVSNGDLDAAAAAAGRLRDWSD